MIKDLIKKMRTNSAMKRKSHDNPETKKGIRNYK